MRIALGTLLLLFQACLGLEINGLEAQIRFTRPQLPASLGELRIHNLEVAGATVDLLLVRHEHDVGVNVLRREGNVEILVEMIRPSASFPSCTLQIWSGAGRATAHFCNKW